VLAILAVVLSRTFSLLVLAIAWLGLALPIWYFAIGWLQTKVSFSVGGLTVDACGVLLILKEWLMQHEENLQKETAAIDRSVGYRTDDEPVDRETLEEVRVATLSRHAADGLKDRMDEHALVAAAGISLLLIGFVYQLIGTLPTFGR
jgi:hypothetical protein